MNYCIHVSEQADREANAIYEWIAERSADGARRWLQAFRKTLDSLMEHPESHALANEADAFEEPLRNALFKTRKGRTFRTFIRRT
jgi:plasmid stabilization system protein ParE